MSAIRRHTACSVLTLSLAFCSLLCGSTLHADSRASNDVQSAKECWAQLDQPKFVLIRNKIKESLNLDASSATTPLDLPTMEEAQQIRAFKRVLGECFFSPQVTKKLVPGDRDMDALMPFVTDSLSLVGAFDLLASRQLTYTQFGFLGRAVFKNVSDLAEAIQKRADEKPQATHDSEPIALTCKLTPTGANSVMGEVEFQYVIDSKSNAAYASRGNGRPTDVLISPSQIVFKQADTTVTISRVSGRADISSNLGVLFTGTCAPMGKPQF